MTTKITPPKVGDIGRYYFESTWVEVTINGVPQLIKDRPVTISKDGLSFTCVTAKEK